jgi:hypothetical protein
MVPRVDCGSGEQGTAVLSNVHGIQPKCDRSGLDPRFENNTDAAGKDERLDIQVLEKSCVMRVSSNMKEFIQRELHTKRM